MSWLAADAVRRRALTTTKVAKLAGLAESSPTVGRESAPSDRLHAGRRQALQARRAVGVGHQDLEGRELRVAGVELAVAVRVEHVGQRLHVARRRRVPVGEDDLVALGDLSRAGEIEHEDAVAGAGPGGARTERVAVIINSFGLSAVAGSWRLFGRHAS